MSFLKDHTSKDSAGRLIAISMALVVGFHDVYTTLLGQAWGWPDAVSTAMAFVSIPLYKAFDGGKGVDLVAKLLDKLGIGAAGVNATAEAVQSVITRFTHRHDPEK